ncbi:hypothetical protein Tco_1546975 [Tanacetum coccineum]
MLSLSCTASKLATVVIALSNTSTPSLIWTDHLLLLEMGEFAQCELHEKQFEILQFGVLQFGVLQLEMFQCEVMQFEVIEVRRLEGTDEEDLR